MAKSTVTASAFAALPKDAQAALIAAGVNIVADGATSATTATPARVTVSDSDIIAAASSYKDNKSGKMVTRLTGTPMVTRTDDNHGVVIGQAADRDGIRVLTYSVTAKGGIWARSVGTFDANGLRSLANAVTAAVNDMPVANRASDTDTVAADIRASKRRAQVLKAIAPMGLSLPADSDSWSLTAVRDWALEAIGAE